MHEKQENKWDVKAGTYHFEDQLESVKYLDRFFKMEKFLLLYYNYGWMREYLSDLILNFNKINITVKPIFFTPKFTGKCEENYLVILIRTKENGNNAEKLVEKKSEVKIGTNCYHLTINTKYILMVATNAEGLKLGIKEFNFLFNYLGEYIEKLHKLDNIKISGVKIYNCK